MDKNLSCLRVMIRTPYFLFDSEWESHTKQFQEAAIMLCYAEGLTENFTFVTKDQHKLLEML